MNATRERSSYLEEMLLQVLVAKADVWLLATKGRDAFTFMSQVTAALLILQ